jgi:hypothetical protein
MHHVIHAFLVRLTYFDYTCVRRLALAASQISKIAQLHNETLKSACCFFICTVFADLQYILDCMPFSIDDQPGGVMSDSYNLGDALS